MSKPNRRKMHQNMDGTKIASKYGRNENCTKIWTEVSRMVVKATRVLFKFIFDYRSMYTATSLWFCIHFIQSIDILLYLTRYVAYSTNVQGLTVIHVIYIWT